MYGISGDIFDIISESFNNRKQIIKFNDFYSNENIVKSGVIQGGVISPILFNVFIAHIIYGLNSYVFKFADHLCLIRILYDENDCNLLQNDLNIIYNYCLENTLKLNPNKCEHLRITYKNVNPFVYKINNINVNIVENHNHIGIIYDIKMSFNLHIDMIIEKALKKFAILKIICKRVNFITFLNLYTTYIRPILEFSNLSIVLTKTQNNRIEKIERKITQFICCKSGNYDMSYEQRLDFLNIFSLQKRRDIQILKTVFKIRYNLFKTENKWSKELSFYENSRNGMFCKIPVIYKSKNFFINASKLFNDLPKSIRNEKSFNKFVNNLEIFL